MSGNLCRCGAYPNIVAAVQDAGGRPVRPFDVRAGPPTPAAPRWPLARRARTRVPGRRHQPGRPDEARRRDARPARRRHPAAADRHRGVARRRPAHRRRRPQQRPRRRPAGPRSATRCCPRPLLAGASGQLRNAATIGGNLLQRTRCRYFQDVTKPCNKRAPGHRLPGRRRRAPRPRRPRHVRALRGHPPVGPGGRAGRAGRPCAAPCTTAAPVPLDRACTVLPGDTPHGETVLPPGALITARLAAAAPARPSRYRKVRDRASYAFAVASVAAALDVVDGTVRDVRIAFGRGRAQALAGVRGRAGAARRPRRPRRPSGPRPTPSWPPPDRCRTTRSRCRWCATSPRPSLGELAGEDR